MLHFIRSSALLRLTGSLLLAHVALFFVAVAAAQEHPAAKLKARREAALRDLTKREWTIDGVVREGLVHIPAATAPKPYPLVFAFHGHGGSMQNAATMFDYHHVWPEAVVVYMQGLNTPGRLTDPEGKKPGWQSSAGDLGDRDLKFFDAMLKSMRETYKVDEKRV